MESYLNKKVRKVSRARLEKALKEVHDKNERIFNQIYKDTADELHNPTVRCQPKP